MCSSDLQVVLRVAGYLGLVLVVLGFVTTRRRGRALGRIARWAFFTGAATFLAYRALPQLLEWGGGWWGGAGALVRAGDAMTTPALILVLAGGLGMLVARTWERRERLHALAAVPVGGSARGAVGSTTSGSVNGGLGSNDEARFTVTLFTFPVPAANLTLPTIQPISGLPRLP